MRESRTALAVFRRLALAAALASGLTCTIAFAADAKPEVKKPAEGHPAGGHPADNREAASGEKMTRANWKPPLKKASDAGERAIQKFKVADGLQVKLWAAEPMLGNPNALCTDEKGRIYVAETYRYHGGVIDVRGAMNWLEEDIKSRTVEERVAMVKRHKAEKPGKEAWDSPDSDRITLLEDTDGDGTADKSTEFASQFNKVEEGLGSGVFAYKGNVFYTCIPHLWRLKDTNHDGVADERTSLQYGYGVRYAFLGHDLHGMVIGPDGKLYFSVGDRGANVTKSVDGKKVQNTESGAVFRCNLDGTGLELFSTGHRNPQELRFDQYGNLFSGDNNPDKGDPARWIYIPEGADSGWRIGYQEGKQPVNGGPWISEQIYQVEANNNNFYITPHVAHLGAGPSGVAYYPGTGLSDKYENTFFMCDFRGGSNNSGIWNVRMKPKGAGFELVGMDDKPVEKTALAKNSIIHGIAVVDCEFAVDGGLWLADWTEGWERPMAGRIYKVTNPEAAKDPIAAEVKRLIELGLEQLAPADLVKLLAHRDMRIRQEAQFALAAKGTESAAAFAAPAAKADRLVTRLHAIWGLGQIAERAKSADALAALVPLLGDTELEVRCQAAKVLGDARTTTAAEPLMKLLADAEPRARFFAAQALGKLGHKPAVAAILKVLEENRDGDGFLRFGCVVALARLNDVDGLAAAAKHESPSVRLGAALALRRLESPAVAAFLNDPDRSVVLEAARAIHDLPLEAALPQLATLADKPASGTKGFAEKPTGDGPGKGGNPADWITWRAVNANYRLGTADAAARLAAIAGRDDVASPIRVEALRDLGDWVQPGGLDRITNLWRPVSAPRDANAAKLAAASVVAKLEKAPGDVRVAATNLMKKLGIGDPAALARTVADAKAAPAVRVAALSTLAAMRDARVTAALALAMTDADPSLRREAIRVTGTLPGGVETLKATLDAGSVGEKQAVINALGDAPAEADPILTQWLDKLLARQVQPELQLDVLEAAAKRKDAGIVAKVKRYEAARPAADKNPLAAYAETLWGGDASLGRTIFRERADVSCLRCHVAENGGGIVGPRLDGMGAKQTREYILESLVAPNAKIAEGFESLIVQTNQGKYRTGVLRKDDEKELVLLNPDNEPNQQLITIPKGDIKSRERGPSAMPENLHLSLSKQDMRNLIEFLASLKQEPVAAPAAK